LPLHDELVMPAEPPQKPAAHLPLHVAFVFVVDEP